MITGDNKEKETGSNNKIPTALKVILIIISAFAKVTLPFTLLAIGLECLRKEETKETRILWWICFSIDILALLIFSFMAMLSLYTSTYTGYIL